MLLNKIHYYTIFLFILASGIIQSAKYLANKNYNVLYVIFLAVITIEIGGWLFRTIWKSLDLPQESETSIEHPDYISYIIDFIVYPSLLYQAIY